MASKRIGSDRTQIQSYVNGYAADLTNRANIRAMIDPPPGHTPASTMMKAIEPATNGLIDPILTARKTNNTRLPPRLYTRRCSPSCPSC